MATKLKKMQLTSVDLVRAGANQEADICLYKSADSQEEGKEMGLFKRFLAWLNAEEPEEVEKKAISFDQFSAGEESRNELWEYKEALYASFESIWKDDKLDDEDKASMMRESLRQFSQAVEGLIHGMEKVGEDEEMRPVLVSVYDEIEEI